MVRACLLQDLLWILKGCLFKKAGMSPYACLTQGLLQRLREGPKRHECHPMATEEKVFNSSPAVDEQYANIDRQERLRMGLTHSASSVGPQQEGIIMAPQPGWTEC